jgi:hypothetical protein
MKTSVWKNFPFQHICFLHLFTEFIQGVSQFSVKGDKESKLRFAFRIYDMDNDGYISNGELFQVFWLHIHVFIVDLSGAVSDSQL